MWMSVQFIHIKEVSSHKNHKLIGHQKKKKKTEIFEHVIVYLAVFYLMTFFNDGKHLTILSCK